MLEDKNLGKIWGWKWQKSLDWIGRGKEGKKKIEKVFEKWRTRAEKGLFVLFFEIRSVKYRSGTNQAKQKLSIKNVKNLDRSKIGFNQPKNRFDWSSTNQASIKPGRNKLKNLRHFRSVKKHINRNSGKFEFLKNIKSFMQKTLKLTYFMNEMHEYEFKSFSKTLDFNPNLPKQDDDIFCP